MVWGTTEYQYTIHAIGQVECGMDYGATNPSDVISVGLFQWYGQRAANVLDTMKTTNPSDWSGIAASLDSDMTAHTPSSSFWSNRYLTLRERQTLHSVMSTSGNIAVQDAQASDDLNNDYIPAGEDAGIDKDTHSETMAFFCNIYNRNPQSARRIIGNCGPDSSLDRIYSFTRNDDTEGQSLLVTRYAQAYQIINDHDTTGVGTSVGDPPGGHPGGNHGGGRPKGKASYIQRRGTQLLLVNKNGSKQFFTQVKPEYWLASFDSNSGVPPIDDPTDPPPSTAISDIIDWELAHLNAFAYSEGAGRLQPFSSGYTDCSGLQYYAYLKFANKDIGTWTGAQIDKGNLVTKDPDVAKDGSTVVIGDLVFYRWDASSPSTYDHVNIYKGGNEVISHGGPDNGPDVESLSGNIDTAISGGGSIMVRRYIT